MRHSRSARNNSRSESQGAKPTGFAPPSSSQTCQKRPSGKARGCRARLIPDVYNSDNINGIVWTLFPNGDGQWNIVTGTFARTVFAASIYWTAETGAHLVLGAIRQHWLQMGGLASALGYLIADETDAPDGKGRVSRFQRGEILRDCNSGFAVHPQEDGSGAAGFDTLTQVGCSSLADSCDQAAAVAPFQA